MRPSSMISFRVVLAAVLILAAWAPAAVAESNWVGGLEPTEIPSGSTVEVDVFVRDKEGEPVLGLTKDHFRVAQDGEEVEVTDFAAHTRESLLRPLGDLGSGSAGETVDGSDTQGKVDPIYIVLYVDNANLRHTARSRVIRSMQHFAESVLAGPARIMVVTHDEKTNIQQPFTDDPREVVMSLRRLRTMPTFLEDADEEHGEIQRQVRRTIKNRNKTQAGRQQVVADLYDEILAYAREEGIRLVKNLQGIHEIGAMLTGIEGRKYIIYVSNGLPLVLAKDILHEFAGVNERMTTTSLSIPFNKRNYYNSLSGAANGLQITIHAVDATGVFSREASIGANDTARATQASTLAHENHLIPLRMVTEKTGGLAVINTDDFDAGFDRIVADLMTYYTVSYTIPTVGVDKVHKIEISLREDAGHDIRYRRAFIEKSLHSQVQEQVNASLFFDAEDNPLGLKLSLGEQREATPDRSMQGVRIAVPMQNLALERDGEDLVASPMVFIVARDIEGRSADVQRRTHEFRIPAVEYERRRNEDVVIELDLLLKFGRHDIAIGVLDELTRRVGISKVEALVR